MKAKKLITSIVSLCMANMKKVICFLLCIVIMCFTLSGCKVGLYMDDYKDVQWTCNELDMQFTYTSDNLEMAKGTLVKDGETIEILCSFTLSKTIDVYDKLQYESRTEDEICAPILIGSYSIEGDIATVKIIQDNLFNGEYLDKEIHLTKTPVE